MPISLDLDHITGRFQSIGRLQLTPIAEIFERLGKWLRTRVKQADLLDEASRGFPVVNFYNEAVALWLDPIQKGALSPEGAPPGFGDQMRAAGQAFLTGIKRIPEAYENEQIFPRFLATAAAAVQAILDSVLRFEQPTGEMFDPRLRRASDLFGEAALAFRAFASSQSQLKEFVYRQFGPAYLILTRPEPGANPAVADPRSTPEMLDRVARYVLGALLILPLLPSLIGRLWESLSVYTKARTIEVFGQIEEKVYGLRRKLIDYFYVDLAKLLLKGLAFASAAGFIVTRQMAFWLDFAILYGKRFLKAIAKFGDALMSYIAKAVKSIEDLINAIDEVLNYDLSPLFMIMFAGLPGYIVSRILPPPRFTVLDFITGPARYSLVAWIETTNAMIGLVYPSPSITLRLHALAMAVNAALSPLPPKKPETRGLSVPPAFPSIFDAWFTHSSAAVLEQKFKDMAEHLPDQVSGIVDTASGAVERTGYLFDEAAEAAASGMSPKELLDITNRAGAMAKLAFGADEESLEKDVAKGGQNIAASTFESWFVTGGFELLTAALPSYVTAMLDTFRQREQIGEDLTFVLTKTSPHILAEKARLGRARMQRLTIDARGRALDDSLVQKVASRFRDAIVDAYNSGRQEIVDIRNLVTEV